MITNAPATFEAHGHTWTAHTPGDPLPCDPDALVVALSRGELKDGNLQPWPYPVKQMIWHERPSFGGALELIGWRYAAPPPEKDEFTQSQLSFEVEELNRVIGHKNAALNELISSNERLREENASMRTAIKEGVEALELLISSRVPNNLLTNGMRSRQCITMALAKLQHSTP